MATRAGLNEIIKCRLYQRGQFLTWPAKQKLMLLERHGVTTVVNLWSKIDPDLSSDALDRVYINWVCSPSAVPPGADAMIALIVDLMNREHCVLIHCEAGRGRSVWLTTRVLAAYRGMSRVAALEKVLIAVPSADLTVALKEDLK